MAIKVLTIRPGDQVVIPRNAVIKTAASYGSITVTSTCPEIQSQLLDNEAYKCYTVSIGTPSDGGHTNVGDRLKFIGLTVAGIKYPFATPVTFDGGDGVDHITTALALSLNQVISEIGKINKLDGLLRGFCSKAATTDGGNGQIAFISFLSLASLAEDNTITLYGTSEGAGTSDVSYIQWTAMPIATFAGGKILPCSCQG